MRGKDKKENQDRHFSSVLQKRKATGVLSERDRRQRLQLWRGLRNQGEDKVCNTVRTVLLL